MTKNSRILVIAIVVAVVALIIWTQSDEDADVSAGAHAQVGQSAGSDAGPPASGVRFVRYVEPSMQAFVVAVPEGWDLRGGVHRVGTSELPYMLLRSPDGKIEIRGGDPRLATTYLEPSQMLQMQGLTEGSSRDGMTVRRFVPPIDLAAAYAERLARENQCHGLEITVRKDERALFEEMTAAQRHAFERERDEAAATLARHMPGVRAHVQPGGVEFRCRGSEEMSGAVQAIATRFEMSDRFGGPPQTGWSAQYVAAIAPADRQAEAEAVMQRYGESFELTPQFKSRSEQSLAHSQRQIEADNARTDAELARMQRETDRIIAQGAADRSRIHAETSEYVSGLQREGFEARMNSNDEMMRRWSNANFGTTDVYDAQTGTTHYGVQSGADAYWADPATNSVIGSQGYDNPDPMRYNPTQNLDDLYNRRDRR